MRLILSILLLCLSNFGFGQSLNNTKPWFISLLKPSGGGGGSAAPGFHLFTNQTDTSTRYLTNTVDTTGVANAIIVNIWHIWNTPIYETNAANGIAMTYSVVTNSYGDGAFGFGVAYLIPPSNGVFRCSFNSNEPNPLEKTCITIVYTNVNQTTPFGTWSVSYSTTARPGVTNTVTSATGDTIFDALGWNDGAVGSVGSGQTRRSLADPAPNNSALATSDKASEGASSTMRWSGFNSGVQVWAGAAMKAP